MNYSLTMCSVCLSFYHENPLPEEYFKILVPFCDFLLLFQGTYVFFYFSFVKKLFLNIKNMHQRLIFYKGNEKSKRFNQKCSKLIVE